MYYVNIYMLYGRWKMEAVLWNDALRGKIYIQYLCIFYFIIYRIGMGRKLSIIIVKCLVMEQWSISYRNGDSDMIMIGNYS
jgi:hypothetical protein